MSFKSKSKASALPLRLRGLNIVNVSVEDQDTLYRDFVGKLPSLPYSTEAVVVGMRDGVIVCKDAITDDGIVSADLYVRFHFRKGVLTIEEIDAREDRTFAKWSVDPKGSIVNSAPVFSVDMAYGEDKERARVVTATVLAILGHITVQRSGSSELRNESVSDFSMGVYRAHPKPGKKGAPKPLEYFSMTVKLPANFEPTSTSKNFDALEVTWFNPAF